MTSANFSGIHGPDTMLRFGKIHLTVDEISSNNIADITERLNYYSSSLASILKAFVYARHH